MSHGSHKSPAQRRQKHSKSPKAGTNTNYYSQAYASGMDDRLSHQVPPQMHVIELHHKANK